MALDPSHPIPPPHPFYMRKHVAVSSRTERTYIAL
jgi:hypothetical protein